MLPVDRKLPGILIEVNAGKNCSEEQLEKLADAALKQINERRYNSEMTSHGVDKILRYGIAFSGKDTCVKAE